MREGCFLHANQRGLVSKSEWPLFDQIAELTKGFPPYLNEGMFPPPPDDDIYDGIEEEGADDR